MAASSPPHKVFFEQCQSSVDPVARLCKIVEFCGILLCIIFFVFFFNFFVFPLILGFASIHKEHWNQAPEMDEAIHRTVEKTKEVESLVRFGGQFLNSQHLCTELCINNTTRKFDADRYWGWVK